MTPSNSMPHPPKPDAAVRHYRFACQDIEARYGHGNFDDAGDHVAEVLRDVSVWENQYPLAFEFDTAHANPWYHAFVVTVTGLPDDVARRFADRMRMLGLPSPRSAD
ncbi:hypothetical protein ACH58_21420 [Achromobacter xylosoxidans]|uniref:hypothetical protein n=1 Tax=Alcaligenes xylosoxydans xylosoxydans TaxID=85698 RepID=UPI00064E1232|nr:hypothetical protein [Achromobacter xylosoxidans]KMJ88898.1 hypothetical protein ACH58_21420 [Achromobacter xylosoxidans]